jgi:hypothetical protein
LPFWAHLRNPSVSCGLWLSSPRPLSWQLPLATPTNWFRLYERTFRSQSGQLICHLFSINSFMTWHLYQLYSVMFCQLYEGLVAVPDQFWIDPRVAQLFNRSLAIWENVDVPLCFHFTLSCATLMWRRYHHCKGNAPVCDPLYATCSEEAAYSEYTRTHRSSPAVEALPRTSLSCIGLHNLCKVTQGGKLWCQCYGREQQGERMEHIRDWRFRGGSSRSELAEANWIKPKLL